jgi:competence protein ComEA
VDDALPPAPGDQVAEPGVPPLDRLLRPPDRVELWRTALDRVRRLDRRILVAVGSAVAAAVVVVGVVASRSGTPSSAQVTLPRARVGDPSGTGSTPGAASDSAASAVATTTTSGGPVVVDVAGAVLRPGLVSVPSGSRVADAVSAAGGFRPDADVDRLNLASPVSDGVRVYVAAVGQTSIPVPVGATPGSGSGGGDGSGATATTPPAPVDLNSATAEQLDTLPGVGPSTAQAIISYRTAHGPFAAVDDLDQVRGIGPAKLSQLRDLVVVG